MEREEVVRESQWWESNVVAWNLDTVVNDIRTRFEFEVEDVAATIIDVVRRNGYPSTLTSKKGVVIPAMARYLEPYGAMLGLHGQAIMRALRQRGATPTAFFGDMMTRGFAVRAEVEEKNLPLLKSDEVMPQYTKEEKMDEAPVKDTLHLVKEHTDIPVTVVQGVLAYDHEVLAEMGITVPECKPTIMVLASRLDGLVSVKVEQNDDPNRPGNKVKTAVATAAISVADFAKLHADPKQFCMRRYGASSPVISNVYGTLVSRVTDVVRRAINQNVRVAPGTWRVDQWYEFLSTCPRELLMALNGLVTDVVQDHVPGQIIMAHNDVPVPNWTPKELYGYLETHRKVRLRERKGQSARTRGWGFTLGKSVIDYLPDPVVDAGKAYYHARLMTEEALDGGFVPAAVAIHFDGELSGINAVTAVRDALGNLSDDVDIYVSSSSAVKAQMVAKSERATYVAAATAMELYQLMELRREDAMAAFAKTQGETDDQYAARIANVVEHKLQHHYMVFDISHPTVGPVSQGGNNVTSDEMKDMEWWKKAHDNYRIIMGGKGKRLRYAQMAKVPLKLDTAWREPLNMYSTHFPHNLHIIIGCLSTTGAREFGSWVPTITEMIKMPFLLANTLRTQYVGMPISLGIARRMGARPLVLPVITPQRATAWEMVIADLPNMPSLELDFSTDTNIGRMLERGVEPSAPGRDLAPVPQVFDITKMDDEQPKQRPKVSMALDFS